MLKALLLLPLFGAAVLSLLPSRSVDLLRHLASLVAAATMVCAFLLLVDFDSGSAEIQFFDTRPWNPRVGSHLALGGDGVSLPEVLLATVRCCVAIFSSTGIRSGARLYFSLLLVLETSLLVVFTSRSGSPCFAAWRFAHIPRCFLVACVLRGEPHRRAHHFVV